MFIMDNELKLNGSLPRESIFLLKKSLSSPGDELRTGMISTRVTSMYLFQAGWIQRYLLILSEKRSGMFRWYL